VVANICRAYRYTYDQALDLPKSKFWMLAKAAGRYLYGQETDDETATDEELTRMGTPVY